MIFGPDSVEITYISTKSIIAKSTTNHASKAYDFSHFMPPSEPVHSLQPLEREGKIIASTSFTSSTSIVDPSLLVYDLEIQNDSDLNSVPTSKLEARKMTGNPSDTQKIEEPCAMSCNLTSFREMQQTPCEMLHGKV